MCHHSRPAQAFDDETSTFTCQTAESQEDDAVPNAAGYNITLCPTDPDFVELGGGVDQACMFVHPFQSCFRFHIVSGWLKANVRG